ncbi:Ig-like domain-containing protein, partial [Nitrosomonas sp.]
MSNDLNNITIGEILYLLKDLALTDERKLEIKQAVESGNIDQVSGFVNNFLNSLIETEGGVAALAQKIIENALDREVSETFTQQVIADSLRRGIDSWWEFFHDVISEDNSEFGKELNQRIIENAPKLDSAIPEDESIEVPRDANIELKFDRPIVGDAGGNIELRIDELGELGEVVSIPVDDSQQVSITNDTTVTINPENDLSPNTRYTVLIDSGAFVDTEFFIPFEGINDSDILNFTTIGPPIPISTQEVSYKENQIADYIITKINAGENSELTNFEIVTDNENDYFNNENGYFAIDEAKQIILTEAGAASVLNDFETLPNEVTLGITATGADGNTRVVEEIALTVLDAIDFTFIADDSVVEGSPLTYTVTTSEP